jgi:ketosteroid isomerase-like protein
MKIAALALLLVVSCASTDPIRPARVEQNRAIANHDGERAAQFWTDDVTLRRGLGHPVSGREAYARLISDRSAPLSYERTTTAVEVSTHWPLAFETGTWVARTAGSSSPVITGRYSAQWVKRDGRWLIRSEVFVALTCSGSGCDAVAMP